MHKQDKHSFPRRCARDGECAEAVCTPAGTCIPQDKHPVERCDSEVNAYTNGSALHSLLAMDVESVASLVADRDLLVRGVGVALGDMQAALREALEANASLRSCVADLTHHNMVLSQTNHSLEMRMDALTAEKAAALRRVDALVAASRRQHLRTSIADQHQGTQQGGVDTALVGDQQRGEDATAITELTAELEAVRQQLSWCMTRCEDLVGVGERVMDCAHVLRSLTADVAITDKSCIEKLGSLGLLTPPKFSGANLGLVQGLLPLRRFGRGDGSGATRSSSDFCKGTSHVPLFFPCAPALCAVLYSARESLGTRARVGDDDARREVGVGHWNECARTGTRGATSMATQLPVDNGPMAIDAAVLRLRDACGVLEAGVFGIQGHISYLGALRDELEGAAGCIDGALSTLRGDQAELLLNNAKLKCRVRELQELLGESMA